MKAEIRIQYNPENLDEKHQALCIMKAQDLAFFAWDISYRFLRFARKEMDLTAEQYREIQEWISESLEQHSINVDELTQ